MILEHLSVHNKIKGLPLEQANKQYCPQWVNETKQHKNDMLNTSKQDTNGMQTSTNGD